MCVYDVCVCCAHVCACMFMCVGVKVCLPLHTWMSDTPQVGPELHLV